MNWIAIFLSEGGGGDIEQKTKEVFTKSVNASVVIDVLSPCGIGYVYTPAQRTPFPDAARLTCLVDSQHPGYNMCARRHEGKKSHAEFKLVDEWWDVHSRYLVCSSQNSQPYRSDKWCRLDFLSLGDRKERPLHSLSQILQHIFVVPPRADEASVLVLHPLLPLPVQHARRLVDRV